ncbi:MAG: hypothetical protein GY944_11765 [bacterium]|nr:hypothetical protein [bacterium]
MTLVAALAVSVLLLGCSSAPRPSLPAAVAVASAAPLTIAVGDRLDFTFFKVDELDEQQTVRPDGKVPLQLVGEVQAAGLTPDGLRQRLVELYRPHLRHPSHLNVVVEKSADRRLFVAGAVQQPGAFELHGPLTIFEAVMLAGGFDAETAEPANVVVLRHRDGHRYGGALDLTATLRGELDADPVFVLEPRDVVHFPRTVVVEAAQWIDQHINQTVPQLGGVYSTPVGNGTLTLDTTAAGLGDE